MSKLKDLLNRLKGRSPASQPEKVQSDILKDIFKGLVPEDIEKIPSIKGNNYPEVSGLEHLVEGYVSSGQNRAEGNIVNTPMGKMIVSAGDTEPGHGRKPPRKRINSKGEVITEGPSYQNIGFDFADPKTPGKKNKLGALTGGVVESVPEGSTGYGNSIIVNSGISIPYGTDENGHPVYYPVKYRYSHLDNQNYSNGKKVKAGDTLEAGQIIGKSGGSGGYATHLDLSTYIEIPTKETSKYGDKKKEAFYQAYKKHRGHTQRKIEQDNGSIVYKDNKFYYNGKQYNLNDLGLLEKRKFNERMIDETGIIQVSPKLFIEEAQKRRENIDENYIMRREGGEIEKINNPENYVTEDGKNIDLTEKPVEYDKKKEAFYQAYKKGGEGGILDFEGKKYKVDLSPEDKAMFDARMKEESPTISREPANIENPIKEALNKYKELKSQPVEEVQEKSDFKDMIAKYAAKEMEKPEPELSEIEQAQLANMTNFVDRSRQGLPPIAEPSFDENDPMKTQRSDIYEVPKFEDGGTVNVDEFLRRQKEEEEKAQEVDYLQAINKGDIDKSIKEASQFGSVDQTDTTGSTEELSVADQITADIDEPEAPKEEPKFDPKSEMAALYKRYEELKNPKKKEGFDLDSFSAGLSEIGAALGTMGNRLDPRAPQLKFKGGQVDALKARQAKAGEAARASIKEKLEILKAMQGKELSPVDKLRNELSIKRLEHQIKEGDRKQSRFEKKEKRLWDTFNFREDQDEKSKLMKITDKYNSAMKDTRTALAQADKAIKFIKSNSKLAPSIMGRLLARMAGEVGVMTDKDVEAFRGSRAWKDSFERFYQAGINGTLTEEDKRVMLKAVDTMRTAEKQYMDNFANVASNQYSRASGIKRDRIFDMIKGKEVSKKEDKKQDDKKLKSSDVVVVRRKSDGKTMTLPKEKAEKYLKDSRFEEVK